EPGPPGGIRPAGGADADLHPSGRLGCRRLMAVATETTTENTVSVLDRGFLALDGAFASDLAVVNAARVSFNTASEEMTERDEGLIRFLMREHHGTPFEHGYFRF